jgi:hypothetical protein
MFLTSDRLRTSDIGSNFHHYISLDDAHTILAAFVRTKETVFGSVDLDIRPGLGQNLCRLVAVGLSQYSICRFSLYLWPFHKLAYEKYSEYTALSQ